ncbi:MAG: hypothetical protein ACYCY5_10335 [Sulfuricella sp.]
MRLVALFYLVTRHGATYHTGHGSDILAGATTDLMSEHSAYDTADDGASTYSATAYPVAAAASDLDRINHAIISAGIG